ncbi:hypothetical protein LguiA_020660 [Lonicera macranthoides]
MSETRAFEKEEETLAIEDAVQVLLQGLGQDINREDHAAGGYFEISITSHIASLPSFHCKYKCFLGYVPSGQRVVGLSKLSEVANIFAKRLQNPHWLADEGSSALHHEIKPAGYFGRELMNPTGKSVLQSVVHFHGFNLQVLEQLTRQIAKTVSALLGGVMVVVEANHVCMISRGIEKFGTKQLQLLYWVDFQPALQQGHFFCRIYQTLLL